MLFKVAAPVCCVRLRLWTELVFGLCVCLSFFAPSFFALMSSVYFIMLGVPLIRHLIRSTPFLSSCRRILDLYLVVLATVPSEVSESLENVAIHRRAFIQSSSPAVLSVRLPLLRSSSWWSCLDWYDAVSGQFRHPYVTRGDDGTNERWRMRHGGRTVAASRRRYIV